MWTPFYQAMYTASTVEFTEVQAEKSVTLYYCLLVLRDIIPYSLCPVLAAVHERSRVNWK